MTTKAPASTTIRYHDYRVEPQPEAWEVICDYDVTITGMPIEDAFHSVCRVAIAYTKADAQFVADCMNRRQRGLGQPPPPDYEVNDRPRWH